MHLVEGDAGATIDSPQYARSSVADFDADDSAGACARVRARAGDAGDRRDQPPDPPAEVTWRGRPYPPVVLSVPGLTRPSVCEYVLGARARGCPAVVRVTACICSVPRLPSSSTSTSEYETPPSSTYRPIRDMSDGDASPSGERKYYNISERPRASAG
jgi:hypothetical protein